MDFEPRILVVDDEPANVVLLQKMLERAGYEHVTSAVDGRATLAAVASGDVDLILLDLHMPGLDGFGVMEALRELVAAEDYLPVLVLTADVTRATRTRALSLGAKDFLTKPFDPDEVVEGLEDILRRSPEQRARIREEEVAKARLLGQIERRFD